MNAKEFYNKKAFKHQLQRAIKRDHAYFRDGVIELMEAYHQEQLKLLNLPVVRFSLGAEAMKLNKNDALEFVFKTKDGGLTSALIPTSKIIELLEEEAYDTITAPCCNSSTCLVNNFCECDPVDEDAVLDHIKLSVGK